MDQLNGGRVEVVIVGSGILGLLVARLLAKQGYEVLVIDAAEEDKGAATSGGIPSRDSQRNHRWLQSGLLYLLYMGPAFGARLWHSGRELLEMVAMKPSDQGGVFSMHPKVLAEFMTLATQAGLDQYVHHLPGHQARLELGDFYPPGLECVTVPDSPFDEGEVMRRLHQLASIDGARFESSRVRLARNGDRVLVELEGRTIDPGSLILCAGCGTPTLLDSIGVAHPLQIHRSLLARFYDPEVCNSLSPELFVRMDNGLAVVRSALEDGSKCLIFGDRQRKLLTPAQALTREVTMEEKAALLAKLPPSIAAHAAEAFTTAGHKTEAVRDGKVTVRPWVRAFPGLVNLVAGLPGKATMALECAREMVNLLDSTAPRKVRYYAGATANLTFRHHDEYKSIDETQRSDQETS